MSIKLKDTIYDLINNSDKLDGKDSSAFSLTSHTHNYASSSSPGGSATSAVKLDSSAGSTTQPIYFSGGKPVSCGTSLAVSVTGNSTTTTKLATSRTIWGQSFNGTANVSGNLTGVGSITRTNNGAVNEDTAGNLVWGSETTDDNNWNVMTSSISRQFSVTKTGLVGINTGTTVASSKLSINACVSDITAGQYKGDIFSIGINGQYGTHIWTRGNGVGYIQVGRQDGGSPSTYDLHLQPHGGNCLIGSGYAVTSTNWTSYIDCFRDRGWIHSGTINTTTQGAYYTTEYTPISGLYSYGTVLNFRSYPTTTQFYIPDGQASGGRAGEIWFRNAWNGQESQGGSWFRIITSKNIGEYSTGGSTFNGYLGAGTLDAAIITSSTATTHGANNSGYFRMGRFDESSGGFKMQFGGTSCNLQIINKAWDTALFTFNTSGDLTINGKLSASSLKLGGQDLTFIT